jgi:hypothetical protein
MDEELSELAKDDSSLFPNSERVQDTEAKRFRFCLLMLHRKKWTLMHQIRDEEDHVRRQLLINNLYDIRNQALM